MSLHTSPNLEKYLQLYEAQVKEWSFSKTKKNKNKNKNIIFKKAILDIHSRHNNFGKIMFKWQNWIVICNTSKESRKIKYLYIQ